MRSMHVTRQFVHLVCLQLSSGKANWVYVYSFHRGKPTGRSLRPVVSNHMGGQKAQSKLASTTHCVLSGCGQHQYKVSFSFTTNKFN